MHGNVLTFRLDTITLRLRKDEPILTIIGITHNTLFIYMCLPVSVKMRCMSKYILSFVFLCKFIIEINYEKLEKKDKSVMIFVIL